MPYRLIHFGLNWVTWLGSSVSITGAIVWGQVDPVSLWPPAAVLSGFLIALLPILREWRRDRESIRIHSAEMVRLQVKLQELEKRNSWLRTLIERNIKRIDAVEVVTDAASRSGLLDVAAPPEALPDPES